MTFRSLLLATLPCLPLIACETQGDDDDQEQGFAIEDAALEACARDALGLDDGEIEEGDVAGIVHLECPDHGVASLAGLEYFTGLQTLTLWENEVEDLTPLAGLTDLVDLQLGNNRIRDIGPLTDLDGLVSLGLGQNQIDDVQALSGLTALRWLNLDGNDLADDDLAALCDLQALTWLTVEHNHLGGVGALDCLSGDTDLYWEFQDELASYAGSAPAGEVYGPEDVGGVEPLAGGVLRVAEDGGAVALRYEVGERRIPVIPEFAGELELRGDVLVLHRGERERAIGVVTGDGAQLCRGDLAADCTAHLGLKADGTADPAYPGAAAPVATLALRLHPADGPQLVETEGSLMLIDAEGDGFGEKFYGLGDFVLASPNQFDAGSCLFMATTGTMEILLNQHVEDPSTIEYKGETDLSERFLMNAYEHVPYSTFDWFFTDLGYTYNAIGGSMLDADYPFIADYIKETYGGIQLSDPSDPDAYFSCYANWIDQLPEDWEDQLVPTPPLERTVIYVDPKRDDSSQWRVGLMDLDDVEAIKHEMRTKRAPVIIVYNHFLYWHADIIVGYNDTAESGGCPMVDQSLTYYQQQGASSYVSTIENHMDDLGGCLDHGIFYVRDSIYEGDNEPMYSYSETYNFTEPMSEKIIERTYNWVLYLSNHAFTVHRG